VSEATRVSPRNALCRVALTQFDVAMSATTEYLHPGFGHHLHIVRGLTAQRSRRILRLEVPDEDMGPAVVGAFMKPHRFTHHRLIVLTGDRVVHGTTCQIWRTGMRAASRFRTR